MPASLPGPTSGSFAPTCPATPGLSRRSLLGRATVALAGVALLASPAPVVTAASRRGDLRSGLRSGCNRDEDAPGLVSDESWHGPSYGLAVSWEPGRWVVGSRRNPWVADSMGQDARPVDCGFGQGGSDRLTLVNGMWESGVYLIESFDRLMWTPESMAEAMTQPGWVQNLGVAQGSPLLLADASGATLAAVGGDADLPGHTVYWQATFPADDDAVIHYQTLHMWETGAIDALDDLDGIAIDGIDPFGVVDLETVRQVIDDFMG